MSRFRHEESGVVVSVSDEKDERFGKGWVPLDGDAAKGRKRTPAKSKAEANSAE